MADEPILFAFDMEGCLTPEIWIEFANKTGIDDLRLTTRDIPNYDELMQYRLQILKKNKLKLTDIQAVIAEMEPLQGAVEFLTWLREQAQLIILSDTFYEFAGPLMAKLEMPTIFCHNLKVDSEDRIIGYRLRVPDAKKVSVQAFLTAGFYVVAVGDSYNDTTMLAEASEGILFRAPENVINEFPQYVVMREYNELKKRFESLLLTH